MAKIVNAENKAVTLAAAISNTDLWNQARNMSPSFASLTAEATADLFTANGYEQMKQLDSNILTDFFGLSMRIWLNIVNISHAVDPFADNGFGEYFDQPWGGIIQRMSIDSISPISPGWVGLKDGDSPDPFVVRKPKTAERFFKQNFDYASLVTIPDDFQFRQMFVSEYGMSEYMAGIFEALQNGYVTQVYLNKKECLNAAINSTATPLQSTQQISVDYDASNPTAEQLTQLTLTIMNVISAMTLYPQTSAYNASKFMSTQDKSRLKLLIRAGYKNAIAVNVLLGAFNPRNLDLGVDVIEVPDFGGLVPYQSVTGNVGTTQLYPVYDSLGAQIGWNTAADQDTVTVQLGEEQYVDPNADVIAVLADKGAVFECRQNPYTVEPIRNPRGRYTNHWASSPNNTIAYDSLYNFVVFRNNG